MSANESFSIHGYNLVTLLKRLEAATSRLEDVTIFQEQSVSPAHGEAEETATKQIAGAPETTSAPVTAPVVASAPVAESLPASVKDFDSFVSSIIDPFVELSKKIDSAVAEQAELVKAAFVKERDFILAASKSKKVSLSDPAFGQSIQPINELLMKIVEFQETNRQSKFLSNLKTVSEGIPVLGWVCVETPVSYIPDFKDSAQFWANKVLKEFKETDPNQVEWVKSFLSLFESLRSYVKEHHATGVTFNANGGSLEENLKSLNESVTTAPAAATDVGSAAPAVAGGAPPPPPPPPPPPADVFEVKEAPKATGINAVFGELNQGSKVTAGLKKVDKSQMTHKNPALRASSSVPAKKEAPVPPKKPTNLSSSPAPVAKPPKMELDGNKWVIANFESSKDMLTIEGEMQQSVFITNCSNVVIQIKNKVNAITLNQCSKIGLVVDSTVSGIEFIKCKKFEFQIIEVVPTVSIDQSDNGSIYLSKSSLSTEIYTSSTTSLNVNVPTGDDDIKELPIPEQFKHTFDASGKVTSTIVEHSG